MILGVEEISLIKVTLEVDIPLDEVEIDIALVKVDVSLLDLTIGDDIMVEVVLGIYISLIEEEKT